MAESSNRWDGDYEDYRLIGVRRAARGGWDMHLVRIKDGVEDPGDDCVFYCPPDSPLKPAVDMTVRLCTAAHQEERVRGLLLDGTEVYYRTEAKDIIFAAQEQAARKACARQQYLEVQDEITQHEERLPEVFQQRIARLRAAIPETFWQFHGVEVAVAEIAVIINHITEHSATEVVAEMRRAGAKLSQDSRARLLQQAYLSFAQLPAEVQRQYVPDIPESLGAREVSVATAFAAALSAGHDEVILKSHAVACLAGYVTCAEGGCTDSPPLVGQLPSGLPIW